MPTIIRLSINPSSHSSRSALASVFRCKLCPGPICHSLRSGVLRLAVLRASACLVPQPRSINVYASLDGVAVNSEKYLFAKVSSRSGSPPAHHSERAGDRPPDDFRCSAAFIDPVTIPMPGAVIIPIHTSGLIMSGHPFRVPPPLPAEDASVLPGGGRCRILSPFPYITFHSFTLYFFSL